MKTKPVTRNDNLNNEEIIQWGCQYLLANGYTLQNHLAECVKNAPWSFVSRFETSDGYIYLKRTPKLLALEANIIQVLHDQFYVSVPKVIAQNRELNCFLMKDAGKSLRDILKQRFDDALLCKAIDQFTALQLAVSNHVDILLAIGVPDWRLNKLPDLYKEVLLQKDLLIADGVSEIEIGELEKLHPLVFNLCEELADYPIRQTIVQPDFNDNNVLVDVMSQKVTVIDLGEISISHPFFSLLNCLQQVRKHYALTENDAMYLKIKEACFKNYMGSQTLDALVIAESVWIVYVIIAQYRLMLACGKEKIIAYQPGRFKSLCKELIAKFNKI